MDSTGRLAGVVAASSHGRMSVGGGEVLERYVPFSDQYLICQRTTEQDVTVNPFY